MIRIVTAVCLLFFANASFALLLQPIAQFGPDLEDSAEIAAFDSTSQRMLVTNVAANQIDIYDFSDPRAGVALLNSIDLSALGEGGPNSVAAFDGLIAVAVEAADPQLPGLVAFYNSDGMLQNTVTVGALPDMLTFTPDGTALVVANEGEPDDDYVVDPEGSISIITVSTLAVTTVGFNDFNAGNPRNGELPPGVRIFGPGATVAQDLEPEFITISEDGSIAYVSLQENNALAMIDIPNAAVLAITDLGVKDNSLPGNGFDASDRDDAINIQNWPTSSFYQPDAIASATIGGQLFVFTANEGDTRDYDGFSEEDRVDDLALDPAVFPNTADLQMEQNLGRLSITTVNGNTDGDPEFEQIFATGARSFGIRDGVTGALVFDSGDDFERITAGFGLPLFNDDDGRSDNRGPEPEGIAVGQINDQWYAFIGLERTGGVMVYNVTNPAAAVFERYVLSPPGDERPEGVSFISATDSPTSFPLLVVSNESSGTVSVFNLIDIAPAVPALSGFGLVLLLVILLAAGGLRLARIRA